jgi:hypothetical protein
VVFPRYAPGGAPKLQPIAAADGLGRLLDECLAIPRRLDVESVATIVETIERTPCWELSLDGSDHPARSIVELVKGMTSTGDD